jgi:hypothetical protein
MLYSRRKRKQALARAESSSGKVDLQTTFSPELRAQILYAARDCAPNSFDSATVFARARLLESLGRFQLADPNSTPAQDFFIFCNRAPDATMPDVLEALYLGLVAHGDGGYSYPPRRMPPNAYKHAGDAFEARLRDLLREHRMAYDMIEGEVIEVQSGPLHEGVVAPALLLTAGDVRLRQVNLDFRKALEELSRNDPGDAITDAGRALASMLTALGCKGNSLGKQLVDARKKQLLGAHDQPFAEAVERAIDWVSADRSERGDAHQDVSPSQYDGQFTIYVVGALIVRLRALLPN